LARNIDELLDNVGRVHPVLDSKRRMFTRSPLDQERELRIRLKRLDRAAKPDEAARRCIARALDTLDFDRYRELQRLYLSKAGIAVHAEYVKYLNLDYWLPAKLKIATALELDRRTPLRILDVGAGSGHFGLACKEFGHDVTATDIDLNEGPEMQAWSHPHLFDALIDFFGIKRVTHKIEAFQQMPHFDQPFDLISAQMVKFNQAGDLLWGPEHWCYWLRDLGENLLSDDGQVFMTLNRGRADRNNLLQDEVKALFQRVGEPLDEKGESYLFASRDALRGL
jgi:hypothetical protein